MKLLLVLSAMNGIALMSLVQQPATVPTSPQTSIVVDQMMSTLIGQMVILITTIAGFFYTVYRENRNRKWDIEDRERVRQELARDVHHQQEALAQKVEFHQQSLKTDVKAHQAELLQKIDENTKISENAFKEANDVNKKIAELAKAYDTVKGRTTALEEDAKADK